MFPRLALLPIGLFVIWCFVCRQWYVCHIKQVCGETQIVVPPDTTAEEDNRPLVFRWSDPTPTTRPATFPAFRDDLVKKLPDKQLLEITGTYFKDEPAPPGFANMGLARAAKVKELLAGLVPAERIVTNSREVAEREGVRTGLFESCDFKYKEAPKDDVVEIIEVDNTISILFPFAKSEKEADPRVDEYLGKLAERLKKTDETVSITGHTDNSGTEASNMKLGMSRALHIQAILVSKGLDKARLSVNSQGESNPVADNTTQEGSRQNRRAVLVLIKKK